VRQHGSAGIARVAQRTRGHNLKPIEELEEGRDAEQGRAGCDGGGIPNEEVYQPAGRGVAKALRFLGALCVSAVSMFSSLRSKSRCARCR